MNADDQEVYDQMRDDDLGAEMNERELIRHPMTGEAIAYNVRIPNDDLTDAEPDDQAMVGALLAQVGYLVTDLSQVDAVATLCSASRETMAHSIHDLDHQLQLLLEVRDGMAQALAQLMEDDHEAIAGLSVARSRSDKVEWDKDGCWRAAKFSIVDRWGTPEHVERVLADVSTAFAVTPRVGGLKAIGVNPHEYRAVTRSERYNVKVQ